MSIKQRFLRFVRRIFRQSNDLVLDYEVIHTECSDAEVFSFATDGMAERDPARQARIERSTKISNAARRQAS